MQDNSPMFAAFYVMLNIWIVFFVLLTAIWTFFVHTLRVAANLNWQYAGLNLNITAEMWYFITS